MIILQMSLKHKSFTPPTSTSPSRHTRGKNDAEDTKRQVDVARIFAVF